MAPSLLFDISEFDLDKVAYDVDVIESINPHRGAMRLLDAVVHCKLDKPSQVIAYKDIRDDEFWVPGHVPGRPLFPGVLMLEAAAQLASFVCLQRLEQKFLGFAGAQDVKFRGQVVPGDRFYLVGQEVKIHPRRSTCQMQGLVNGKLVFEATIVGMVF
ncbi:MAG TPA: beta-hydroxyacyl-ACP dehydratase [Phycisphaerales bacterium]|nr:beta-hydroxyacyl-ACP dehydratase [Phycisphaerales bacterium]HCD31444.1 beta-hydroxyacyl-ACP dehydratase [Phycisphaerales bacterium]|tara:strand:+ start:51 stop:524 length:474 start_codon:yes stop_codon:yes gene_type:complete